MNKINMELSDKDYYNLKWILEWVEHRFNSKPHFTDTFLGIQKENIEFDKSISKTVKTILGKI